MRIYEGSPRQDYEEVLRSIGAYLDGRGMREILLAEAPDGFIVQGLVASEAQTAAWSEAVGIMPPVARPREIEAGSPAAADIEALQRENAELRRQLGQRGS